MVPVIPRRADQCGVEPGELVQRGLPIDIGDAFAGVQCGEQRGHLLIVFKGIGAAIGRAGQRGAAGEEGDFHEKGP